MAKAKIKTALFWYTTQPTAAEQLKVEQYYAAGGYGATYFRKKLDPVGNRDVIEQTFDIIGGTFPSIYTTKFGADATKVLDGTDPAKIYDGTYVAPPTETGGTASTGGVPAP